MIKFFDQKGKPAGVTGFVVIAESHISVHTYPETGHYAMDIFSCKSFDDKKTIAFLKKRINLPKLETHVVERGRMYETH